MKLFRLFCILALPYLVLRKSLEPVVHMREFNVQSFGVNAIFIITNTAISYSYWDILCFVFLPLYNMFHLLHFTENIIKADFKFINLLNVDFNDFK